MKVFISWSGTHSREVAEALRKWLPDVIQSVEPWMSASDIEAGARWGQDIQSELNKSKFGILCITPENQFAPWMLFEAGALAKTIDDTFVCPYLFDLGPSALDAGPLTQFQSKQATKEGTYELVRSVNRAAKDEGLSADQLDRAFGRWWPDLESILGQVPVQVPQGPRRSANEMIEEILVLTREIRRILRQTINLQTVLSTHDRVARRVPLEDDLGRTSQNILAYWSKHYEHANDLLPLVLASLADLGERTSLDSDIKPSDQDESNKTESV